MALALNVMHNIAAVNTRKHMAANNGDLELRLERLSSGLRINGADDDASGLSVSEGFRAQISGLSVGVRNAEMGANMVQVAEGSLNEVSAMLIRLRELAVQASTSTLNANNRESIEAEANQIKQEIDRIAHSTVYNDQALLTGFGNRVDEASSTVLTEAAATGATAVKVSGVVEGTYTFADSAEDSMVTLGNGVVSQTISIGTLLDQHHGVATGTTSVMNFDRLGVQVTIAGHGVSNATGSYVDGDFDGMTVQVSSGTGGSFQVGAYDVAADRVEVNMGDMRASGSTLNLNTVSMSTLDSARAAITRIDLAANQVANQRGTLGATMNRLQHTISFTDNSIENSTSSEATLRDADMAAEVTRFTRSQILSQAATAMLSQAHLKPQGALSLLQ
jgi:flagellin